MSGVHLQVQAAGEGIKDGNGSGTIRSLISAVCDGKTVASLGMYDNPAIRFRGGDTMLFGDLRIPAGREDLLTALLQRAKPEAAIQGKQYLIGPMNGSTWRDYRLPLDGEAAMFSGDSALPASWKRPIEHAGFAIADTYRSSIGGIAPGLLQPSLTGVAIRTITAATLRDDLTSLYPLCMSAFGDAPYFSPLPEDDFISQYEAARPLLGPGLSFIAHQGEAAVGFILAYPDLLAPERKTIVIKTLAKHPGRRIPGLTRYLVDTVYCEAARQGYARAIHAFMHDDNHSVKRSDDYGATTFRRYALFAKRIALHG